MRREARLLGGARVARLWESLRTSFWFVPALMTAGAIALSFLSVHVDDLVEVKWVRRTGWIWVGSAEGARLVLSTIAGSMITVAGVVFSITIVALTLASSQFGPRLLRSFVRDLGNQLVLGTFIATFVYCLLVLRTVRGGEDAGFVPHLSVTLGVFFALASLGVLIYFIHHVAVSMQAEPLIESVAEELHGAIRRLFPEQLGAPAAMRDEAGTGPAALSGAIAIAAEASGYVQAVDEEGLMATAREAGVVVEVLRAPGAFVIEKSTVARAWPAANVDRPVVERLRGAFILGQRRTPTQDPEYAVHSIVEIGARALSPGINDPFTAIACLDRLGAALAELAAREIPTSHRYDGDGLLRVIARGSDFPAMADAAFDQLRQYGRGSVAVVLRLLDTIGALAEHVRRDEDRLALRRHADKVAADARVSVPNEHDRREVDRRHAATLAALAEVRTAAECRVEISVATATRET